MAVLLPGTVGEAVDHACAAYPRRESALVPVVVALDGPTIAFAVQEAALPEPALLGRLLGRPADSVHSASVAQSELFGEHRRRIPRWHDATLALRLGGELGPQAARCRLRRGADLLRARSRPASSTRAQRASPSRPDGRCRRLSGRSAQGFRPRSDRERRLLRNRSFSGGDARAFGSAPRCAGAASAGSLARSRARCSSSATAAAGGARAHRHVATGAAGELTETVRAALARAGSAGAMAPKSPRSRGGGGSIAGRCRSRRRLPRVGRALPLAAPPRACARGERRLSQAPGAARPVAPRASGLGRARGAWRRRDRSASRWRRHRPLRAPVGGRRAGA